MLQMTPVKSFILGFTSFFFRRNPNFETWENCDL